MSMVRVPWWRIRRPRHVHPVNSGKSAEVVVKGMILFENDHNTVELTRTHKTRPLLRRNHVKLRALDHSAFIFCVPTAWIREDSQMIGCRNAKFTASVGAVTISCHVDRAAVWWRMLFRYFDRKSWLSDLVKGESRSWAEIWL